MPPTFSILLHWKRQQRVFLQNLAILTKQQHKKAIHDLRVTIKKLRSYLKLLTILLNKMDSEPGLEKTERLFSVLGKQRDIEIGLLLLQSFEQENRVTYPVFRLHMQVALQRVEIWVQEALSKYDEKELTGITQKLGVQLRETDKQKLLDTTRSILNKEFKKLKWGAKHFSNHPHEMRKTLKNIYYWISICPRDFLINSAELKKLKKTLEVLGHWQDHEMLHRKIKHFRMDFVPDSGEEYLLLKELEKSIESKMETKLQKAEEEIMSSFLYK